MPEDILPEAQPSKGAEQAKPKNKISIIGIILAFFLTITLVLLGERIIFDLNRAANPAIEATVSKNQPIGQQSYSYSKYGYERSGLSNTKVYYKKADQSRYITYKLLIHSAFIIPIFLLVFLFYYLYHIKKSSPNLKVVIYAYFAFAFWMIMHLLGEVGKYVIDQFENAAIYIILGLLVIIITPLAIFIQKKVDQRAD